jgi:hypothetical protein
MREITVLDVIARECGADFTATLAEYVRLCPEGARLAAGAALALLQLSGNALRNNPEDNLYRMMLYSAETLDVERCNEILQQAELAPLTRGTFY